MENINIERMLQGKIYDPFEGNLSKERQRCHILCQQYNQIPESDYKKREEILDQLMPNRGKNVYLQGPIQFDYGKYITMGDNSYANFNFVVLDVCEVKIGKNVFFGPNCSLYCPLHPLCYQDRNTYYDEEKGYVTEKEYGKPIVIEDNCWICGNVTVCPGVTIGEGCVIGAGSVVTRNIPPNSLAFGVPCKVIRQLNENDRLKYKTDIL